MGVIRGIVQVPYGRRGVAGPMETTIGGTWPWVRCSCCDGWKDPETGEHAVTQTLAEALAEVSSADSAKRDK